MASRTAQWFDTVLNQVSLGIHHSWDFLKSSANWQQIRSEMTSVEAFGVNVDDAMKSDYVYVSG